MPGDNILAANIILNLGLGHCHDHFLKFVPDFIETVAMARVGLVHPSRSCRFDKQDSIDLLALREYRGQPGKVRGHNVVGLPPGFMVREGLGVVAFPGPANRNIRKMFVEGIDAKNI